MALVQGACKLKEDAPYLVLLHLFAGALVLADHSSKVAVLAKFHDDIDRRGLAVDDAILSKRNGFMQSQVKGGSDRFNGHCSRRASKPAPHRPQT